MNVRRLIPARSAAADADSFLSTSEVYRIPPLRILSDHPIGLRVSICHLDGMQPYDPNQHIQIVTKPGGLTGAAHAVHILIVLFTCGIWLIPYLIFIAAAPRERFEVIAPAGADPQLVAQARLNAIARSKVPKVPHVPQAPLTRHQILVRIAIVGGAVAFIAASAGLTALLR